MKLCEYFPEIPVPDAWPDEYISSNGMLIEAAPSDALLQVWHPNGDHPGLYLSTGFNCGPRYQDTIAIEKLARTGLAPALGFLGIEATVHQLESGTHVAALTHPASAPFCERFNQLVAAESNPDSPPLTAELHLGPGGEFSAEKSTESISQGRILVANAPKMSGHDIAHAVAAYCLIGLPLNVLQSRAQVARSQGDRQTIVTFARIFEAASSVVGLEDIIEINTWNGADRAIQYQDALGWNRLPENSPDISSSIISRIHTTEQRLQQAGIHP